MKQRDDVIKQASVMAERHLESANTSTGRRWLESWSTGWLPSPEDLFNRDGIGYVLQFCGARNDGKFFQVTSTIQSEEVSGKESFIRLADIRSKEAALALQKYLDPNCDCAILGYADNKEREPEPVLAPCRVHEVGQAA